MAHKSSKLILPPLYKPMRYKRPIIYCISVLLVGNASLSREKLLLIVSMYWFVNITIISITNTSKYPELFPCSLLYLSHLEVLLVNDIFHFSSGSCKEIFSKTLIRLFFFCYKHESFHFPRPRNSLLCRYHFVQSLNRPLALQSVHTHLCQNFQFFKS